MDDKEWQELYAPLSRTKLSDTARVRIRRALAQEAAAEGGSRLAAMANEKEAHHSMVARTARKQRATNMKNVIWLAGTVAVAASLVAFSVFGPGRNAIVPPIQPASQGAGRYVAVTKPFRSVQMVNAQVGWAAAQGGEVLRTEDGGQTWYDVSPLALPSAGTDTYVSTPFFLRGDAQAAWVLDFRTDNVFRTTDGGKHWQKGAAPKLDLANDGGAFLSFATQQNGWLMVGTGAHNQGGQLFETKDGGMTWTAVAKTGNAGSGLPSGGQITFSPTVSGLGWLQPDRANQGKASLYVTHDGGKTWAPQQLTQPADARAQNYLEQLPQFSGGKDGILPVTVLGTQYNYALFYTTVDGGATWNLGGKIPNIGSSMQLLTSVVDEQTLRCYAPDGNKLWLTGDGGKSWSSENPQPTLYDPVPGAGHLQVIQIDFVSANEGWAVDMSGALLHSKDGGRTWAVPGQTQAPIGSIPAVGATLAAPPGTVSMLDSQNGYGSAPDHPVAVTHDGGLTWTDVTPKDPGVDPQMAIVKGYFVNAQTGWTFSLKSNQDMTVYGTQDGGQSWTKLATVPVKYGDGNMSIAFADAQHGWFEEMTAGMGQLSGELFATSDGGKTWAKVADSQKGSGATATPGGNLPFGGQITAQSDGTLWLNGAQRAAGSQGGPGFIWFFKSNDGGKTWEQVKLPLAGHQQDFASVSQPTFLGKTALVTVLYNGSNSSYVLYSSTDLGKTWVVQSTTVPAGNGPVFGNPMVGWQTDGQSIYRTQDGGKSWQKLTADATLQKALTNRMISQIDFVDYQHGWAVLESQGANAVPVLLATNDGGQTWSNLKR